MNKTILFERIFAGAGILLLTVSAAWAYFQYRFVRESLLMEGTVVDYQVDGSYAPVFVYEYPPGIRRRVVSAAGTNPPLFGIGEKVQVYVHPEKAGRAEIKGFLIQWMAPLVPGFFALGFGGVGAGLMMLRIRKRKRKAYLLRHGDVLKATLAGVKLNPSVSVDGEHPYVLVAHAQVGEVLHEFRSEDLWFDPTGHIQRDEVDIYHMPGNLRAYSMDVSFLPKRAAD